MIGLFLSFLIYISKSISRVLSWIVIYLGYILLYISSHQLRKMTSSLSLPIFRCCSRWGLHWPSMSPYQRWALTSPFHPYLVKANFVLYKLSKLNLYNYFVAFPLSHKALLCGNPISEAVIFCCTFLKVSLTGR